MNRIVQCALVVGLLTLGANVASAQLVAVIDLNDGSLVFINETGAPLNLVSYQLSRPPATDAWDVSQWVPISGDDSLGTATTLTEVGISPIWNAAIGESIGLGTPYNVGNFASHNAGDFEFIATSDSTASPQIDTAVRIIPIPEPASLALVGMGGMMLLLRRRQ